MARKKKNELQVIIDSLMTLSEASQWIEEHKEEFNLTTGLNTDTLKKASQDGRLKAALKGRNFITREPELREYLQNFDPKNKRENRPVKPRTLKRRQIRAENKNNNSQPAAKTEDAL